MNENDQISNSSNSSTSRYLLYGMPRLGAALVLGIEGWAVFALYTIGYGVAPFLVAFALAMGYLSIAASQFLLGWLSDSKYTRWGRRKPYLLIFSPLLGISFILLLIPALVLPDLNDKYTLFLWLLVWDIVFRFSYGVTTPYQSWTAEQFNVTERPKVSQFQNIFAFIGNGTMAVVTLLVLTGVFEKVSKSPNVIPIEFIVPIAIFAILFVVLFYLIVFLMPTEPNFKIDSSLTTNLKKIIKNKTFMKVVLMQGITSIALAITTRIMLYYTEVVLDLTGSDYIAIAAFLLIGIFAFLYLWRKSIQKKGKKQTLLNILLLGILFLPITLFGLLPIVSNLIFGAIFIVGIAAILGGWFLFPYIMYADLAEDDEKTTGELKAGLYTGFPSIILNLFQAFGLLVIGIVLSLPPMGGLGYSIGLVIWGPICSIVLIITWLYTKKYVVLDFEWENK